MMATHDDEFLDSVAVFALGALPEAEARAVAAHLMSCDGCRREYEELRSVANLVGYAAESTPAELDELSAALMKSGVMRQVRGAVRNSAAPSRAKSPWPYYAAAAALVAAILTGMQSVSLRSENDAQRRQIVGLEQQFTSDSLAHQNAEVRERAMEKRLAQVLAPGAKHFAVPSGEVIETDGKILIAFAHLAPAPDGKVYQAWTLARGAKTVAPSITFVPDSSGLAVIELPESAANLAAVAVSVEPPSGSKAPTSKPTFVRALS